LFSRRILVFNQNWVFKKYWIKHNRFL
jgi:hypothetical protein